MMTHCTIDDNTRPFFAIRRRAINIQWHATVVFVSLFCSTLNSSFPLFRTRNRSFDYEHQTTFFEFNKNDSLSNYLTDLTEFLLFSGTTRAFATQKLRTKQPLASNRLNFICKYLCLGDGKMHIISFTLFSMKQNWRELSKTMIASVVCEIKFD